MDLFTVFTEMHCPSRGNVQTFLNQLCVKHEELAAMGVTMTSKEYQSAILKGIPEEMSKFMSGLLTVACMLQLNTPVDPDALIDCISDEADCLVSC
jgi:hypothetical protein